MRVKRPSDDPQLGLFCNTPLFYHPTTFKLTRLKGRFVIVNPPGWMKMAMKLFRPFMSAKTLAKMSICEGSGLDQHEISEVQFI